MAYARFGKDSDVYVYSSIYGGFECACCPLNNNMSLHFDTRSGIKLHLEKHKYLGFRVPKSALDRLSLEIAEIGEESKPIVDEIGNWKLERGQ